jgi:hypothetical protein
MALKVGQRVRILVNTPEDTPVEGTVRVVQKKAGKKVGVELDRYAEFGHTLDGKLDAAEKVDGSTGVRYGKGWWTLEDNVEAL